VTVESPIEFMFSPRRAYIRQREVGRDTPSFEQALLDALREDPDVLMIGEMRDPETMRLTLSAAESGHLVLVTMHSSTCAEALQRLAASFPPEIQAAVCAQLADCLIGVIAQRLRYRPDLNLRVPECEVLVTNTPARHMIRSREFFKLSQVMETGVDHGMFTFQRYQNWLANRKDWHLPPAQPEPVEGETTPEIPPASLSPSASSSVPSERATPSRPGDKSKTGGPLEIDPVEGGLDAVLKKLI
jgi:twitching motility protein PilT